MPLSKKKNRDRMRIIRLHGANAHRIVQPKEVITPVIDADGKKARNKMAVVK